MRHLVRSSLVTGALVAASVGVAAAPAAAARTIVVGPGQSIQAAVFRAHPGDTIIIKPGHYRESVFVGTDGLRIRGSGAGANGTVIEPGKPDRRNMCSTADGGNGFCVIGSASDSTSGVSISGLTVRNFHGNGIIAFGADGLNVDNLNLANNGGYGIFRLASTGGSIIRVKAWGSAEAGIYVGDSPQAFVTVAGNEVWDNGIGIFFRHSRHGHFVYNLMHDNCIGMLALSAPPNPPVGDAIISYNTVKNNNRFCPASDDAPATQGGGIVLVGATSTQVGHNSVLNNRGAQFGSGGIVLESGAPFGGGPSTGNVIQNNTAFRNAPLDIVDHSGGSNTFRHNFCNRPNRLCHS